MSEAGPRWGIVDAVGGFVVALFLATTVGGTVAAIAGWESTDDAPIWGIAVLQVPLWVGLVGAVLFASYRRGTKSLRRDFGLEWRGRDVPFGLACGVVAQIVVSTVISWPVIKLSGASYDDYQEPAQRLADKAAAASWWGVALLVLVVVLGAPVVEELFYRGLLHRALQQRFGGLAAAVIGGVSFGLAHFELLQLPALAVFGVLLGVLTWRSGRLGPALFTHIGFNATTVVALLAGWV